MASLESLAGKVPSLSSVAIGALVGIAVWLGQNTVTTVHQNSARISVTESRVNGLERGQDRIEAKVDKVLDSVLRRKREDRP